MRINSRHSKLSNLFVELAVATATAARRGRHRPAVPETQTRTIARDAVSSRGPAGASRLASSALRCCLPSLPSRVSPVIYNSQWSAYPHHHSPSAAPVHYSLCLSLPPQRPAPLTAAAPALPQVPNPSNSDHRHRHSPLATAYLLPPHHRLSPPQGPARPPRESA